MVRYIARKQGGTISTARYTCKDLMKAHKTNNVGAQILGSWRYYTLTVQHPPPLAFLSFVSLCVGQLYMWPTLLATNRLHHIPQGHSTVCIIIYIPLTLIALQRYKGPHYEGQ